MKPVPGRTLLWLFLGGIGTVWADGILIPDPPAADLAVRYHRVGVTIVDQTARTAVDQVFRNPEAREVEATYLFPLPSGASVSAFSLHVDGQPLTAEILAADEARRIYEEIVRRRIDPALLEYAGRGAYRARIYPVPALGEKRIELAYEEVLPRQAGIVRYVYPLNTERFSTEPLEEVSVTVDLRSTAPIKAIYSPSHQIVVERQGEYQARVIYADEQVTPREDFVLYYTVADEAVGLARIIRPGHEKGSFPCSKWLRSRSFEGVESSTTTREGKLPCAKIASWPSATQVWGARSCKRTSRGAC